MLWKTTMTRLRKTTYMQIYMFPSNETWPRWEMRRISVDSEQLWGNTRA